MRARVTVQGPNGTREIALQDFFRDFYETALAPNEIVTGIVVPEASKPAKMSYTKYVTRSSEDRPCLGACAWVDVDDGGVCRELRVTLGAVAGIPQEFPEAESLATGHTLSDDVVKDIAEYYSEHIDPIGDMRGSAWYRKQMAAVFVRRAIGQALEREAA